MTRQTIRNIKKVLNNSSIDVASIYDISFIGKIICAILCRQEDTVIIAEVINSSRTGAHILKDFDPREPGVFSRGILQAERSVGLPLSS